MPRTEKKNNKIKNSAKRNKTYKMKLNRAEKIAQKADEKEKNANNKPRRLTKGLWPKSANNDCQKMVDLCKSSLVGHNWCL